MSILQCIGVTKRFGGLVALDGVDLIVNPGEIVGLVGPNGSGKTTLLSMIGGSLSRSGGRIHFKGRDISGLPAHLRSRLGIARTFQVPRPLPSLDVLGNVMLPAQFSRERVASPEARARAMETLARVGLASHAHTPTSALTLHERKFLEIARALALSPELLLLDEVLGGLNPTEAESGVELIARLRDSGVAILYIEHNVKAVTRLADRMYVLNRGRNLASGTPADVIRDPNVIEAYLGSKHA